MGSGRSLDFPHSYMHCALGAKYEQDLQCAAWRRCCAGSDGEEDFKSFISVNLSSVEHVCLEIIVLQRRKQGFPRRA